MRELVDDHFPAAERIVLVLDNLNTHTPAALYHAFPPAEAKRIWDKLELHYTPKHGSWLNIAEIELSALGRQCLRRRIPDRRDAGRRGRRLGRARNAAGVRVDWHFTTADARTKLTPPLPRPPTRHLTCGRTTEPAKDLGASAPSCSLEDAGCRAERASSGSATKAARRPRSFASSG